MVVKLRNPKRWTLMPDGEVISLFGEGVRTVRLEVNAVTDASLTAVYPDHKSIFLASVKGVEIVEFVADGPMEVWVTSESDVYFYTDDGRRIALVDDGKVSFTQPHERRGATEQLIYMQGLMLANMTRRNAQLEGYRLAAEQREEQREVDRRAAEAVVSEPKAGEAVSASGDPGAESVAKPSERKAGTAAADAAAVAQEKSGED